MKGHTADLDMIAAGGFKFVRMDFSWAGTERQKGVYDWSGYDELTRNLDERGLRALYILDYSNPLYEEKVTSKNPINGEMRETVASPQHAESVAAFARWAGAAAEHFKGRRVIWEIWNEPNIHFWSPKPDAGQYINLALATSQAVRRADPAATVVGPATSAVPLEFLESCFKAGLLEHWDAVSVHPYRNYTQGPETAAKDYQKVRELIARYAPPGRKDLPILSGEWGYASHEKGVSPVQQGAFAARQQLSNLLNGVPLSIWYDWKNDGPDRKEREHNFGTVTAGLEPKPAYVYLRTLTRELAGYGVDRRLKLGSEEDYLVLWTKAGGASKLTVWTTGDSHSLEVSAVNGERVEGKTSDGREYQPRLLESHKLVLEVDPSPRYLTLSGATITD